MVTLSKGDNSVKVILHPSVKGSILKGKNLLPWAWGANSFLLEQTPFQKDVQECKSEVIKSCFFLFFFLLGFYGPFKNISLISSQPFIKGGQKPEKPGKNHLAICKQNLAFPHVIRARL